MNTKNSDLGARLQAEKLRLGLTQRDMARLGGVSQATYSGYENNKSVPTLDFVIQLASHGVDPWFLMFGTPAPNSLSADEALLLMDYRALGTHEKFKASVAVRQLGLSSNNPLPAVHDATAPIPADAARAALEQAGVKVKGDAGNINTGPVDQSNMTMIVGRRAKVIKRDDKK